MAVTDRDRWRELERLLDRAFELPAESRASWLAELRSTSPELAAELTALLAAHAVAERRGFLEGTPSSPNELFGQMDLRRYLESALGDGYAIERELGGGMSRVFLARERALGRAVAIKVLAPVLAAAMSIERFKREILIAAQLQHPNIVPVFSVGELDRVPFYIMPFVEGESLRARLARGEPMPAEQAVSVLRDVARALDYAHGRGIAHRDIKPENVLLAGDAAVVTDFGIAKAISSSTHDAAGVGQRDATLSAVGSIIGTPAYMAPEQVVGDSRVDHRADVYAWGIVAYELLAGRHPFAPHITIEKLLAAHLSEVPQPLSQYAPELPPTVAAVVTRCLEKDPARRPQSAREILDALAVVATPPSSSVPRGWRERGRGSRVVMAAAGVLALALTTYLATARRADRSDGRVPAGARTLAVLPFESVGGDTANAYFAEGIADEISSALSKATGLRVASRTSAAVYRAGHDVDVRELGRRLGVNTVLEGRVRRHDDRMRLTVQLTSVADGLALWSETYEREVQDVFRVQDEIARSVVGALSVRLPGIAGPQSARPVSSPGTTDPEAYDLYLRGSYLLDRRGGGVSKAVEYFERAIAKDSSFARAYAGLAYALELLPNYASTPPRAVERRATDAARHALAIDPTLAEAYTALGLAHTLALRWREADEAFHRAASVDPGFAPGEYFYGSYLLRVGRVAEAEGHMRRARIDDPLSVPASGLLAYCLSLLGRYDESMVESRRGYDLDSSAAGVRGFVPLAMLHAGHPAEARAIARVAVVPPFNGVGVAAYVLGATGDRAGAAATIRELEALPRGEWSVATGLSYAYLGVGDTSRALSALETAAQAGERPYLSFADPMFDPVRQSARFVAAVRRLGLDERSFTALVVRRR